MKKRYLIVILCILAVIVVFIIKWGANEPRNERKQVGVSVSEAPGQSVPDSIVYDTLKASGSKSHRILDSMHLVSIHNIDHTIFVDLKYVTTDNFTGRVLYDDLTDAYLQPDVALMLAEAHRHLKILHPGLRLLVYDAVRPLSVQRIMWEYTKDTKYRSYIADPDKAGLHNYGAAVDLTLADTLMRPLDMGTPFDYFGKAAGISNEQELLEQGVLNAQQIQNRQLLRQVMRHAGFRSISGEWWHFNACSLQEAKKRYALIESF